MLSSKESLKILKETNALLEGHFILSSGLRSPKYVQCAKLFQNPNKAIIICKSLSKKIDKEFTGIDLILSPAMGGIIVGYEIAKILKKQNIFAERINGVFSLRRGFKIKPGSNVLIIEDVITTGKSSLECENLVIKSKANIIGFACIIDRTNGKSKIKKKIVSQLSLIIPTYDEKNLPENLQKITPIKPGSREV